MRAPHVLYDCDTKQCLAFLVENDGCCYEKMLPDASRVATVANACMWYEARELLVYECCGGRISALRSKCRRFKIRHRERFTGLELFNSVVIKCPLLGWC
ncbi:hypothetical protein AVEN_203461-1 [Araneus ventricosus]|uniref:Uncharacterized protein n=1 Tax=Araneus ventricosus TaxID=182803 RepID=A0A4Y2BJ78_ARAVE|nr:hypothetical protein AVEN_203461-1 [Araneus ventricosus]